ncbi:MAG: DUF3738 domain-containing protein [Acidobacteria bacterium Pan2503]|uniref:DUF3738 domain-containing protein n=1 Tax=Candidatus Acidiferrum panamense TaxID=2741543 RepID=A0A7V8NU48_9BACT|nr:DUF3738 domain-containing protein [Candidatus Acidoferrum panamensis]
MSGAIGQQLGLSLKLRRGPVEILVIDHAAKHRRTRDAARCSYPSSDQSHHFSARRPKRRLAFLNAAASDRTI